MPKEEKTSLDGSFNMKRAVMFAVAVLVTLVLWFLPLDADRKSVGRERVC